jgi:hypothetical protein
MMYILIVLLFHADGSTSRWLSPNGPTSHEECLEQITDAYAGEYTDSVLTCEAVTSDDHD